MLPLVVRNLFVCARSTRLDSTKIKQGAGRKGGPVETYRWKRSVFQVLPILASGAHDMTLFPAVGSSITALAGKSSLFVSHVWPALTVPDPPKYANQHANTPQS